MAQPLTIPEDPGLALRVRQAAAKNALAHAVILSGRGDLPRAARFLAAAMECEGADRPCGMCPACDKVLRDIHPDVITVEDPDHKNLSMDVLRQIRSDAYILPNEGRRKVYIFPNCEIFDSKTQNVFLKVLEEGPTHAAFIFCAANSAVLLQTIRSRCVEWKLSGEADAADTGSGAEELCRLLCRGKTADITAFCTDLENSKITREELQRLLSDARDLVSRALADCYGADGGSDLTGQMARDMGRQKLSATADVLQTFARQCAYQVGVGHLTGALAVELTK